MLIVLWANAIDQAITLQDVFLAEQLLGFLVLTVRADNFSGQRLAVLFGVPARSRIHAQERALLIVVVLLGLQAESGGAAESGRDDHSHELHIASPKSIFIRSIELPV